MSKKFNPFTGTLDIVSEGTSTWGAILGTLSNQLDLQGELNLKANVTHTHVSADITDFSVAVSSNIDVANNTLDRHTHPNKALLDSYTQSNLNLADAVAKKHTQNTDIALRTDKLIVDVGGNTTIQGTLGYKVYVQASEPILPMNMHTAIWENSSTGIVTLIYKTSAGVNKLVELD